MTVSTHRCTHEAGKGIGFTIWSKQKLILTTKPFFSCSKDSFSKRRVGGGTTLILREVQQFAFSEAETLFCANTCSNSLPPCSMKPSNTRRKCKTPSRVGRNNSKTSHHRLAAGSFASRPHWAMGSQWQLWPVCTPRGLQKGANQLGPPSSSPRHRTEWKRGLQTTPRKEKENSKRCSKQCKGAT